MFRRGKPAFVIAVVASALVAACSSSSKKSSTATGSATGNTVAAAGSPSTCTGPGISNGTIKIGVLETESGDPQVAADFKWAGPIVQARFNIANAAGGVDGYKLETVDADDADSETGNLAGARQLVEQDNVFGLIEETVFPGGGSAYLHGKNIPVTGWATATDPFGIYNDFFGGAGGLPAPSTSYSTLSMGFMHDVMGVTNVGIVGIDDPGAIAVSNADAQVAKSLGMKVFEDNVPIAQSDFTADVAKMKSAGVNGVIMYTSPVAALTMIPEATQANLGAKFLLSTGYDSRFLAVASKLQGVYFESAYAPFELGLPGSVQMKQAFPSGAPLGIGEVNAWLSADLFVKGLSVAGGCPTRQSFITNLRQVHDYTANGILSPIDEATALTHGAACFYHEIVKGSVFVPVEQAGHPYCGKPIKVS
jgi:ABC-type branched-subunit amino acid transport system substrate-binding protein